MITIVLLTLSLQSTPLQPVSSASDIGKAVYLNSDYFFASTPKNLYKWDNTGRLVANFEAKENEQFLFFYIDGPQLILSAFVDNTPKYILISKNMDRTYLESQKLGRIVRVNGKNFFQNSFSRNQFWVENFLFQFQEIEIRTVRNKLEFREVGEPFFKLTKSQTDLSFNFKEAWLVADGPNSWLGLNELEAKIFRFTPTVIASELSKGTDVPNQAPSATLSLPAFQPAPSSWFKMPKGIWEAKDYRVKFREWWMSFSRFKGFYRLGEGILVGYSVPKQDQEQGLGEQLYLAKLSSSFQVVGEPIITDGLLMGVRGEAVYVIEPNYDNPINPSQGGMSPIVHIHRFD